MCSERCVRNMASYPSQYSGSRACCCKYQSERGIGRSDRPLLTLNLPWRELYQFESCVKQEIIPSGLTNRARPDQLHGWSDGSAVFQTPTADILTLTTRKSQFLSGTSLAAGTALNERAIYGPRVMDENSPFERCDAYILVNLR